MERRLELSGIPLTHLLLEGRDDACRLLAEALELRDHLRWIRSLPDAAKAERIEQCHRAALHRTWPSFTRSRRHRDADARQEPFKHRPPRHDNARRAARQGAP